MQLKKSLTIITKILLGIFVVIYPFVIFYALQQNIAIKFMGLVLLAVVIFSFLRNKNTYMFTAGLTLCFLIMLFNQEIFLKLYPVLMNACMCAIFALSLNKKPLITKFAEKLQSRPLNKHEVQYTTKATIAWVIFMAINTVVSFITVFLSNQIWVWYNGLISYILIGTMMLGEYIVRKKVNKCSHQ